MQKNLLVPKYTAIRQLISIQIRRSVSIYAAERKSVYTKLDNIHLYRDRDKSKISYASSVALILSKSDNMRAWEFAQGIKEHLSANLGDQFFVHVNPPGIIQVWVSDKFIANWLDSLASDPPKGFSSSSLGKPPRPDCFTATAQVARERASLTNLSYEDRAVANSTGLVSHSSSLFTIQYCHARCCSLLRLGEQEGMIKLGEKSRGKESKIAIHHQEQDFESYLLSQNTPKTFWLEGHSQMRCDHKTTRYLIYELVQMVDCFYEDWEASQGQGNHRKKINWEKNVLGLINAFEAFWADCRIWGEVKSTFPELAQMRLGLILVTRIVLKFLLLEHLGLAAPESM